MRKITLVMMASLVLSQVIYAQNTTELTQTIRGVVSDNDSGELLQSAMVKLEGTSIGVTTDAEGTFVLSRVPIGRHTVSVNYLGYETSIIKEILVGSAKEVYLEVGLVQKPIELEGLVVRPQINKAKPLNEMALLGGQMFSVEEASRFAGGMDDPARLASSYAGVATPSVSNNGISVRGNAPSLLQWRLEGVEIPNPNHFADVDVLGGGFLSALSSNVLGNSDFMNGAFPAEFNNAVSGVFDMKLRNGNNQNYEHTFQFGVLGIDFASEGPISKKQRSSYLVNYRYSTTQLVEKIRGKEDMGGTLGYQDLNFKLNFPTQKAGVFSLWGVGFIDNVDPILEDFGKWKYLDDGSLTGAKQKSGAGGLSHKYLFGNRKTSLNTTLAVTYLGNSIDEEVVDLDNNRSPRTDMTLNTTNLVFTSFVNHKFGARHTNKTGVTVTNIDYDMNLDFTPTFGNPLANYAKATGNTTLISAYSNSKVALGRKFLLSVGVNMQHLALNKNTTVEPRTSLKWQATPKSSLAVGYGLHSRMEKPDVYFVKDANGNQPNKNLDLTKSHHLILSYNYRISDNMNLRVEPYYQYLFDVPVTADGSFSILNRDHYYLTELLVNEGKGRNYGVDLTFERYFQRGFYYMVTASLFNSEYRAADNSWYSTKYNRRFILNGLIGKEWMFKRDVLGVNLKLTLMGGKRYSPVDEAATMAHPDKEVQYDETRMYAEQFSPMFIGDFSISYKMNRKRVAHEFAIKSVNATKQKEYKEHKYNIQTGVIEPYRPETSMFNISYRIEF